MLPMPDDLSLNEIRKYLKAEYLSMKQFISDFKDSDWENDKWINILLYQLLDTYDRNLRANYFHNKYPGFDKGFIANKIINGYMTYAGTIGAFSGASVTGLPLIAGIPVAIVDVVTLTRLQMLMVLELATVYRVEIDKDNPDDIATIVMCVFGAKALDFGRVGLLNITKRQAPKVLDKAMTGNTWAIKRLLKNVSGKWFTKPQIIGKAVPMIGLAIGLGYNSLATRSVGFGAKHFLSPDSYIEELLRRLLRKMNSYHFVFPVAILYMAQVDKNYHLREVKLYQMIIPMMKINEHLVDDFEEMLEDEELILKTIKDELEDESFDLLLELLIIMATYDGKVAKAERKLLEKVAKTHNAEVDKASLDYYLNLVTNDMPDDEFEENVENDESDDINV